MSVTYWNPLDCNAGITVATSELKATANSGPAWKSVRATPQLPSGSKLYFEIHADTITGSAWGLIVGVVNGSANLANYAGSDANSFGLQATLGFLGTGSAGTAPVFTVGDVVGVAIDTSAKLAWFNKNNGVWSGDPVAGTSGCNLSGLGSSFYPALSLFSSGNAATARFDSNDLSYAPPSGYSALSTLTPGATDAIAAGLPRESLIEGATSVRDGGAARESLIEGATAVRGGGAVRAVLLGTLTEARTGGVPREALIEATTMLASAGLPRELLVREAVPVTIDLLGAEINALAGTFVTPEQLTLPVLPNWSQADFAQALVDLLPQGKVWPKFPGSTLYQVVAALVGTYWRDVASVLPDQASARGSTDRALDLLRDTMPWWAKLGSGTVIELLPEWNVTLGLPSSCSSETASLEQQVQQAVAKFIGLGGQSIPFITGFAGNLGFAITVEEFVGFRVDLDHADDLLRDENAIFVWEVATPDTGSWLFQTDLNHADEALGGFGSTLLECELNQIKPAHTEILYVTTS